MSNMSDAFIEKKKTGFVAMPSEQDEYIYKWAWKKTLPERYGQPCKLISSCGWNVIIEFKDGHQEHVSRYAIRRIESRPKNAPFVLPPDMREMPSLKDIMSGKYNKLR